MKKLIMFLLLFVGISYVKAESVWDIKPVSSLMMSSKIKENLTCENNVCTSFITIPSDYDEEFINIVPQLFNEPIETMPGDTYEYKIVIQNNSEHDYAYLTNTFYIKPLKSNDSVLDIKSYLGENINNGGVMYRLNSSKPLMALYDSKVKLTDAMLSDEELNKALVNKGYKGINELDKYIMDYLNYPGDSLENHADEVAKAMWPNISEMPKVKETNKNLIKFGYDYFYNKLFSMHITKTNLDDETYSIGNCLRDEIRYNEIDKMFSEINLKRQTENTLKSLYFHLNGPLTRNPYVLFEFGLDFGFKLTRLDKEIVPDNNTDSIIKNDSNNITSELENISSSPVVNTGIDSKITLIILINLLALLIVLFINLGIIKYEKNIK